MIKSELNRKTASILSKEHVYVLWYFLIFFLFSTRTWYFYQIDAAPGPIFAALLLLISSVRFSVSLGHARKAIFLIVFVTLEVVISTLRIDDIYLNSVVGIVMGVALFVVLPYHFANRSKAISIALDGIIVIHVIFWLAQFVWFFAFGDIPNFLEAITGEKSRNFNHLGIIRASGLFNEPMTYSAFILSINFMRMLYYRKLDWIGYSALITSFFSFSLFGMIMAFFQFLILFRWSSLEIVKYSLIFAIVLSGVLVVPSISDILLRIGEERFLNISNDSSFDYRYKSSATAFVNDNELLFFGDGIGNYSSDKSVNDLSTLLQGFTAFGAFGGLLFWLLILVVRLSTSKSWLFLGWLLLWLMGDLRIQQLWFWVVISFWVGHKKFHRYVNS
jgi:hypothetical protein